MPYDRVPSMATRERRPTTVEALLADTRNQLDRLGSDRDPELAQRGRRVILICNEGFQSSLAAATLQRFGLDATDVIGGAQAWRAAGLPLERG